ncbi:glycosyltransferase family 9 protein [Nisaea sp.]|uniref:tetratricopeptide repeat-containing glycosyltransferase family protein n=1 Tax=Nisaea sp. TaxID=2024842 RepID=UPI003B52CBC9
MSEKADRLIVPTPESSQASPSIASLSLKVLISTGDALLAQRRLGVAKLLFQEALKRKPWSNRALAGLGRVYNEKLVPDRALLCLSKLSVYRPDFPRAAAGCARAFSSLGDYRSAEKWFERATIVEPSMRGHSVALGVTKLRLGKWQEGWALYDLREGRETLIQTLGHDRVWDGSGDIDGKRVLVVGEQGFGDHIHFMRYCRLLKERGAYVIFLTRPEIQRLASWLPEIDEVVTNQDKTRFDYAVMAMSLPRLFSTTPESIPLRQPYLSPPKRQSERETERSPFKIAIAWKGNPDNSRDAVRSCPAYLMAELVREFEHVEFTGLPFDLAAEKDPDLAAITPLCGEHADFAGVAEALGEIDLVISVDTSLAHLAAAIGKPTWILIGHHPDWRWLVHGADSLWYESMRLFRIDSDWSELIQRVKKELSLHLPAGLR